MKTTNFIYKVTVTEASFLSLRIFNTFMSFNEEISLQETEQTRNAEIKTKRAFGYKTACWTNEARR